MFAKTSKEDGVQTSEVLSHEVLEALVDPDVTDESKIRKYLDHELGLWYIGEVCDAVQETAYQIYGVTVANFCWPRWWDQPQTRPQYDQRGVLTSAFELAPGGYMSVAPEKEPGAWKQITAQSPAA